MASYTDAHGIEIFYDHYPAEHPRAVVQLLHGVGEHAGRYGVLAGALVGAGFSVYADDHRGHGRTGMGQHRDPALLGRLGEGGLRATVAAAWQFTELIRAANPGLPLVIIGHSWGSFLTQILVNRHPEAYDAMVLSGSALRWPGSLNGGDLNKPWRGPHASGLEWLASDPAVAEAFAADALTTSTPLPQLFGLLDSARLFGLPRKRLGHDIATLILVGEHDTVGGPVSNHRLAEAYRRRSGFTDVTMIVYPGARHEVFNEVMQEQVRSDLIAWLDTPGRLPAVPRA